LRRGRNRALRENHKHQIFSHFNFLSIRVSITGQLTLGRTGFGFGLRPAGENHQRDKQREDNHFQLLSDQSNLRRLQCKQAPNGCPNKGLNAPNKLFDVFPEPFIGAPFRRRQPRSLIFPPE
jgi:hypothetical protein